MKLTMKTLKQLTYDIDVASDEVTVFELKSTIESTHSLDHKTLKLVFNGVILDDSKKLVDYNIKEGNVIVLMMMKIQPKNVSKVEEVKQEEKVPEIKPTANTSTGGSLPKPEADYSAQTKELMDMGFPKSESEACVKAAKGNLILAVEFITNGIPENYNIPEETTGSQVPNPDSPQAVLKNISSIVKILCYNNPANLQNILLTLREHSPEIIELIKQNEDEFKALIEQPINDEDMRAFQDFNRQSQGAFGGANEGSSTSTDPQISQGQGGRNYIKLSKHDYDAVGRLKELGFNETDSLQAYFACDKNEDMAANLLWENKLKEQEQEFYIDCIISFNT
jgi:UV excision repair protein RAD23